VLRDQGDLPAARESYRASLAIRERLAKTDPGNAYWQRDLAWSHYKIGDALRNRRAALESYRASLAVRERLANADPANGGWQYDLGISNERIGNVLMAQSDLGSKDRQERTASRLTFRASVRSMPPRSSCAMAGVGMATS
jgi:hypothetical protein